MDLMPEIVNELWYASDTDPETTLEETLNQFDVQT